jgi:hypothetical protein
VRRHHKINELLGEAKRQSWPCKFADPLRTRQRRFRFLDLLKGLLPDRTGGANWESASRRLGILSIQVADGATGLLAALPAWRFSIRSVRGYRSTLSAYLVLPAIHRAPTLVPANGPDRASRHVTLDLQP